MVHLSQLIFLHWQLPEPVARPIFLISTPHMPASKSLFPNRNFSGTLKTHPINISLVVNFPDSKIYTQMVSLYEQMDFFLNFHSFQVFSVCSVAPSHITSSAPLSDFLPIVLVSRYNRTAAWFPLVHAMEAVGFDQVLSNQYLFIACVNLQQLPNLNSSLHS